MFLIHSRHTNEEVKVNKKQTIPARVNLELDNAINIINFTKWNIKINFRIRCSTKLKSKIKMKNWDAYLGFIGGKGKTSQSSLHTKYPTPWLQPAKKRALWHMW